MHITEKSKKAIENAGSSTHVLIHKGELKRLILAAEELNRIKNLATDGDKFDFNDALNLDKITKGLNQPIWDEGSIKSYKIDVIIQEMPYGMVHAVSSLERSDDEKINHKHMTSLITGMYTYLYDTVMNGEFKPPH